MCIRDRGCTGRIWRFSRPEKTAIAFFMKIGWGLAMGRSWGFKGSIKHKKQEFFNYAVAKYILEANIEAKSGWPLPKPSTNYPVLSTVLEGYNYIRWPQYKPPSTEQWTHCEVLISGIKSLNITFITKSIYLAVLLDTVLDYSYVLCTGYPHSWVSTRIRRVPPHYLLVF